MAVERRERLHERGQLVGGEVAAHRQRRVQRGGAMPLRQNQSVTVVTVGVGGIDVEHGVVEHREDVGDGEVAADVAEAGRGDHLDDVAALLAGAVLEQPGLPGRRFGGERLAEVTPSGHPQLVSRQHANIHSLVNTTPGHTMTRSPTNVKGSRGRGDQLGADSEEAHRTAVVDLGEAVEQADRRSRHDLGVLGRLGQFGDTSRRVERREAHDDRRPARSSARRRRRRPSPGRPAHAARPRRRGDRRDRWRTSSDG